MNQDKIKPEEQEGFFLSKKEQEEVGDTYQEYFKYRNYRSGSIRQFQFHSFDDYLKKSRELFWNSFVSIESEDLSSLGLSLNLPFVRKEVMEFLSRITALNIKPRITGDNLDSYGIKILSCLYNRWRFKGNDKVEKFWQVLYGIVNGTVFIHVGFNNQKKMERFLKKVDLDKGIFEITEEERAVWNDVETVIIPIEDLYLKKIYERNIQKQGRIIWKTQMEKSDFLAEFGKYPASKFVVEGARIAEDSLYFRLLGGTGVTSTNKIEVLRDYDTDNDKYKIVSNGIWINKLGSGDNIVAAPMPYNHKMMPIVSSINEPIDEKFAYGLSMPFKIKDSHKMLNASFVMLMERELRAINQPILSSDIETPEIVYKTGKIIPVGDVSAYKQLEMSEASNSFFTSMNSIQQNMTAQAQGGSTQIVPSVQPKSAKEISQMEQLRQQAIGSALTMYYDMVRQEIILILKTMLQFYTTGKFKNESDRILKILTIPDMPLAQGGTGDVELRLVKDSTDPLELYFEAIKKSMEKGKMTEIIEAPLELIQNLEFHIHSIDLEPEKTDEIERSVYYETVLQPLINIWIPMGLADPGKVFKQFLQKNGEYLQDYAKDAVMQQIYGNANMNSQMPQELQGLNRAGQAGSSAQSPIGMSMGGMSKGGQGMLTR